MLPLDLGRMLVIDYNEFNDNEIKNNTDDYLSSLTRDNVQLLVNDIWQVDDISVVFGKGQFSKLYLILVINRTR